MKKKLLETTASASAVAIAPEMVPLTRGPAVFGLSRSAFYRASAEGHIRMVKLGRSTLVDAASVRAYLAQLPTLKPKAAA